MANTFCGISIICDVSFLLVSSKNPQLFLQYLGNKLGITFMVGWIQARQCVVDVHLGWGLLGGSAGCGGGGRGLG